MTTSPPRSKQKPETAKDASPAGQPRKRVRLVPEVRRQQILDAALIEFSSLGFTAASISRIAARAGTSKANLYVHFANKDEIFETLLKDVLVPSNGVWPASQPGQGLGERIDAFIDERYDELTPQVISIIRLLISESHRIPDLIQRWHEDDLVPARDEQQRRIDRFVADGQLRESPLTEHFGFVMAPLLYAAVLKMVFRQDVAETETRKIKETHRRMLHQLLTPVHEDNPPAAGKSRPRRA
ncbi:TetR family transcriptional regulator [Comamonas sp. BIGb0124]|uniref:TetR/AcrR family transcriptional regulator n=1 Tax=Comamonas sp. BIGb0124 TaxID=2485130 RepID=UPI000F4913BF|nr:TetR/AcrR family transcriptional regulator [Comamonas sp. BIGb0124]ROR21697.1 TetR family transcriptional regulator [Comamonas sp. BIGb0124]